MSFLSWLYVPKCTVCRKRLDADRTLPLCDECLLLWEKEKQSDCPICGQSAGKCWCGIPLDTKGAIYAERHLSYYTSHSESVTKVMILGMKKKMLYPLAKMLSTELAEAIADDINTENCVIVNVPRSRRNVRYYGFDQTLVLSEGVSKILNIPLVQVLVHEGKTIQKTLDYKARILNANRSYNLPKENKYLVKGKNVILLDDVVTTGATVSRCASLIKRAGAARIYVVCIAKAY